MFSTLVKQTAVTLIQFRYEALRGEDRILKINKMLRVNKNGLLSGFLFAATSSIFCYAMLIIEDCNVHFTNVNMFKILREFVLIGFSNLLS